jgi:hypothetical protein
MRDIECRSSPTMGAMARRVALLSMLVVPGLVTTGCAPGGDGDHAGIVRDSAGVRIVTSGAGGQWAEGSQWRAVEDLRIGEVEAAPEYTFIDIGAVAVAPGDTVFVLDQADQTIKAYDPQGRFVRQFGGEGEGPGEFRFPAELIATPRGLLTFDWQLRRLTLFGRDGHVIRTTMVDRSIAFIRKGLRALDDSTLMLLVGTGYSTTPKPEMEGTFWLARLSMDGRIIDTLTGGPAHDEVVYRGSGMVFVRGAPFPRGPHFDVAPDGRVAVGVGDPYAIDLYRYTPEAHLVSSIRRMVAALPATEADRAAYSAQYDNPRARSEFRKLDAEMLATITFPETWPAYNDLRFDPANRLWVEESAHTLDSLVPWAVFAPDGGLLGTVAVPRRLQVHVIGNEATWGVEHNALGVAFVVRYRIERG